MDNGESLKKPTNQAMKKTSQLNHTILSTFLAFFISYHNIMERHQN